MTEYKVPELEAGYGCKATEAQQLRATLKALRDAVRARQSVTAAAVKATK